MEYLSHTDLIGTRVGQNGGEGDRAVLCRLCKKSTVDVWVLSGVTSQMHPACLACPFALELPGRGGSLFGHVHWRSQGCLSVWSLYYLSAREMIQTSTVAQDVQSPERWLIQAAEEVNSFSRASQWDQTRALQPERASERARREHLLCGPGREKLGALSLC